MAKATIPIPVLKIITKAFWDKLGPVSLQKEKLKALAVTNLVFGVEKDLSEGQKYEYVIGGKTYIIYDGKYHKIVVGPDYNYYFSKRDGEFRRWGATYEDDPMYSPIGPEIADIEITTKCSGSLSKNKDGSWIRKPCSFCYKSNTPQGINMSFETFKEIIDKVPLCLTQVAFGADSTATSNPDLWKMAKYCREIGIVPNITVADVSEEVADKLADVMGAVAVSRYECKDSCYDTVQKLVSRGMSQVNIHYMISQETLEGCVETINDMVTDERLKGMNAIVMLSLKQKGRGVKFTPLTQDQYSMLVNLSLEKGISFGFDSCGCRKFFDAIADHADYERFKEVGEPCESTCFSWYVDARGLCYPCSFCEEVKGWECGVDVKKSEDFIADVWNDSRIQDFRKKITANIHNPHGARECIIYKI